MATSDDDVPPFSAPGATTEPLAESPLERTKFLGDMGFEAPVPLPVPRFADGSEAASASVVAAPATSPAAPAASAVARAASSSARGAAVVATTRIARPGRPVAVGAAVPALATGAHAAIEGSQTQLRQRKLAMAAIVASLVILPVLVVIVFFALQGSGASAGPAASHPSETTAAAAHAPSGTTSPVPATRETAPPPVRLTDEPPDPPPASASSSAPAPPPPTTAPPKTATTAPTPAPPPPAPPPPTTDELGTIVVVVVGSSCAIAVDGKSHGVGASANVKVPAGAHTVTCKPSGGAMKSKSVTVKAGKSSMAMFKL